MQETSTRSPGAGPVQTRRAENRQARAGGGRMPGRGRAAMLSLVDRRFEMPAPKRIVIATDGSPGAREAVRAGVELAQRSGAVATFVCVRPGPPGVLGTPIYQCSLSVELGRAHAALADAEALAEQAGVEHESEILEGDAARRVAELTGARYAALGVIDRAGTHLERFITTGIGPDVYAAIGDLPRGRGILGTLIREAKPLRLRDLTEDDRSAGFPDNHPPMHSFL